MLYHRHTRILFKQISNYKTVYNPLKVNEIIRYKFYDNYEAITYFIKYLRKRQINIRSEPDSYYKVKRKPPRGTLISNEAPNTYDFFTFRFREWWKHKKDDLQEYIENDQYQKHIKFGPDLAAALFIVQMGGKVRFKNHNEWINKTQKDELSKLNKYGANYILEELDLNGYPIRYQHLHFIFNLYYLKSLSFRGCKSINDWCLDKLSAEYPMLEKLDISECENVTERGIEALYRMPNLKTLIVTNFHGSAAFDLTCFMLEDINPHLTCQIQQSKYKRLNT
ncbi:distal membrane-arm assembly complex protein 2 [Apis florea]|uniref:distal membrane-arm assembly complex protein 2 n=1 Tax=Apis florea TaxID=7463 RepID=UPI0006291A73|nr:distal membrane-arm assembly complex protein 2 [Apis florea]